MVNKRLDRILSALLVIILVPSSLLKLVGAPPSEYVFGTLGVEPWGRYLTGALELTSSGLLLLPHTRLLGALLALGILIGAAGSHLVVLGVSIQGDHGLSFASACLGIGASLLLLRSLLSRAPVAQQPT